MRRLTLLCALLVSANVYADHQKGKDCRPQPCEACPPCASSWQALEEHDRIVSECVNGCARACESSLAGQPKSPPTITVSLLTGAQDVHLVCKPKVKRLPDGSRMSIEVCRARFWRPQGGSK